MDRIEHELQQAFLKLPTLNHVGMALLQFVCGIRNTTTVRMKAGGVFHLDFVAFSFPEGEERIRMHVNVDIEKIDAMDMRWLRLESTPGFPACEIKRPNQLGQATRYIERANEKYMTTQQIARSPSQN